MVINADTVDILNGIIKGMEINIHITEVIDDGGDLFTLLVCNTKHLTVQSKIVIDGTQYKIVDIVQNESIQVKKGKATAPNPVPGTVLLPPPFFIHGTIISTKNELDKILDGKMKYPMIYLYEIYEENIIVDKTKRVGYESQLRLFFMDKTDPNNYTNATQYKEVVRPMRSLVESFIDVLETGNRDKIGKLESNMRLVPWVNFGKFETEKGNTRKLFNDDISGYELKITLPILRSYLLKLKCENSQNC